MFVDGDFWHGLGWRERGYPDLAAQFGTNRDFWIQKIERNVERDAEVTQQLAELGWTVVRILESQIRGDLPQCVIRIENALGSNQLP